ncbi:two-component response regulator ARR14 isoform X1 [Vigna angularis]|uniref:two-component response regulator ARR14 isoform X1 n=1 Tax=Phaseolus angularis TaxID=3914 RepID=UPI00080A3772|nr:two-component response regulator ARR14 isoform X1 [Vigna angularis]XP_017442373.1 two-component response regulator ARR14 isoform X1 [Vigna angularis]XP_052724590.1 two-component response regulator ARR14 isoform X1 [Vigna angularis]XP_052724591.1 two-component response regulator ARR14 isoform X1 [Vigna angularis]
MDSNMFQSADSRKYYCPVLGLKVLVLDNNLKCLAAVSKMLQALGYEVVTASLASEALSIVKEKRNELNLALVEVHLPDMGIVLLSQKIRELTTMPYFLMTANNNTLGELFGSKLCFEKPIKISDLNSLWKYALWRIEDGRVITIDVEGFGRFQSQETIVNNNRECESFINTGGQTLQSVIIGERKHEIGGKQSESLMLGRKRLNQTYDSHVKFLGGGGVELAGTSALPDQRTQLRNVSGLAIQNIESHFQQYLRQVSPIQHHSNMHSSNLNMGSQHLFQADNDNRKRCQLQNLPMNICDCMHQYSLRNPLLDFLNSSDQTSTSGKNQFYTSDSGEFMNNENNIDGKVFSEDTCIYCVDDFSGQSEMNFCTLSSNEMCQQFPPSFPVPLLPSDGKEDNISEVKADEILYPPNGTQKFSDEDLNTCLSMYNDP